MKFNREQLLQDLRLSVEEAAKAVTIFKSLSFERLNFKASAESWSILECIEHLNRYGDFYLPEIEKQITLAAKKPMAIEFRSGVLGNYFANAMLPVQGQVRKMMTFKKMDPANSELSVTVLDRFLKQQDHLLLLLNMAAEVDLTRVTTGITLTSLLRFRLGDTFRFFTNHISRHVVQAQKLVS